MTPAEVVARTNAVTHLCLNGMFVASCVVILVFLASGAVALAESFRSELRHNDELRRRMRGDR